MMVQILKKNPELRNEKDLHTLAPLIREIEFFKNHSIQAQHLADVCQELRHEIIPQGDFVFYQGDYGDKFYVILSGRVQVLVNNVEYLRSKKKERLEKEKDVNRKLSTQPKKSIGKASIHLQDDLPIVHSISRKGDQLS
jgi:CRP-like cAMP-binding protein